MRASLLFAAVLLILFLLAAAVLARAARGPRAATGGEAPGAGPHALGAALERFSRRLGPRDLVALHPLDRDGYAPLEAPRGGGPRPAGAAWTRHASWASLRADPAAAAEYLAARARVLEYPDLDWGPVLQALGPKLAEDREYIGVANLGADGRKVELVAFEASPRAAGEERPELEFAGIPDRLVAKYARRPALFLIHTHPSNARCDPLPSTPDLVSAVQFGAQGQFAAHAVVSRYGVLAYGLEWAGYTAIHTAADPALALRNLAHDVAASHEAMRSWAPHGMQDHLAFYPRHRLFMFAYPSPEMVADSRRNFWPGDLERPADHELLGALAPRGPRGEAGAAARRPRGRARAPKKTVAA